MKPSSLIILWLLTALYSFSQQNCDTTIPQSDRIELQNFWTSFKEAINNKDKVKLASLIRFPYTCDYCIIDSSKQRHRPYTKVTKAIFDRSQYQIFFTDKLVKEVNKHNLPEDLFIFQPYYNTIDKKCCYSFQYIAIEEDVKNPGMQHFFDIQKINGQFKIVSAWTLPWLKKSLLTSFFYTETADHKPQTTNPPSAFSSSSKYYK